METVDRVSGYVSVVSRLRMVYSLTKIFEGQGSLNLVPIYVIEDFQVGLTKRKVIRGERD